MAAQIRGRAALAANPPAGPLPLNDACDCVSLRPSSTAFSPRAMPSSKADALQQSVVGLDIH